jgi:hypothetical protein
MLRRLACNLGGVAAKSGRGVFGAVPAVAAQQRSAGGLMVVRARPFLRLIGCAREGSWGLRVRGNPEPNSTPALHDGADAN